MVSCWTADPFLCGRKMYFGFGGEYRFSCWFSAEGRVCIQDRVNSRGMEPAASGDGNSERADFLRLCRL